MANNKIVFNGNTLIDLTADTVTATNLANGIKAHDKSGAAITGTLVLQNFYTGTDDPTQSLGNNGDLYLKLKG